MKFAINKVTGLNNVADLNKIQNTVFSLYSIDEINDMVKQLHDQLQEAILPEVSPKVTGIGIWLFGKTSMDRPVYSISINLNDQKRSVRGTISFCRIYGKFEKIMVKMRGIFKKD